MPEWLSAVLVFKGNMALKLRQASDMRPQRKNLSR